MVLTGEGAKERERSNDVELHKASVEACHHKTFDTYDAEKSQARKSERLMGKNYGAKRGI